MEGLRRRELRSFSDRRILERYSREVHERHFDAFRVLFYPSFEQYIVEISCKIHNRIVIRGQICTSQDSTNRLLMFTGIVDFLLCNIHAKGLICFCDTENDLAFLNLLD